MAVGSSFERLTHHFWMMLAMPGLFQITTSKHSSDLNYTSLVPAKLQSQFANERWRLPEGAEKCAGLF